MSDTVNLTIDGRQIKASKGTTVLEVAAAYGIPIPFFCYHPKLKPVGACRMCLVEVEGMPKLQTSCTIEAREGMAVYTNNEKVVKARKAVLEFLLINHPLDCPICDKGGECPLQNTTYTYGPDISRYIEEKWHFEKPVELGPRILLDRERCIMCMRCVRFCDEIAGHNELTFYNTGRGIEIGAVEGKTFSSNFSGNTIEICPVGALTSKSYRFKARPWDLKSTPSICTHCPLGCNVFMDSRRDELLRIVSRENSGVDDGWLCDTGRFGFENLNGENRLKVPLVKEEGIFKESTFDDALKHIAGKLFETAEKYGPDSVAAIGSHQCTNEDNYIFGKFFTEVVKSSNVDFGHCSEVLDNLLPLSEKIRWGKVKSLNKSGLILIFGADVSKLVPVLDLRIKKCVENGTLLAIFNDSSVELSGYALKTITYQKNSESIFIRDLKKVLSLKEPPIADKSDSFDVQAAFKFFKEASLAKNVTMLIGEEFLRDAGIVSLVELITSKLEKGGFIEFLPVLKGGNTAGALAMKNYFGRTNNTIDIFEGIREGKIKALYLMGFNPLKEGLASKFEADSLQKLDFLAVQDIFLTETAKLAGVVLPAQAYTERDGSYINLERRIQWLRASEKPFGSSLTDWEIIAKLSEKANKPFNFTSVQEIFKDMSEKIPEFSEQTHEKIGLKGTFLK